ncbi:MAG: crossover junction endodeoxyribonuclease RuvC [Candidatus Pacebacteria bacterium]|jgi:crossover junction endodeoxyribonuclease RuvC|nr:crossover junction endodeoxyribonuclease RuvC [Candidatus Paceibacterota bacterium]
MKIIAIDPGYERLGIAIVEKNGTGKEHVIYSDCFKTSAKLPHPERLALVGAEVTRIIREYAPERLATETLFFMEKNRKTAIAVAEARGVILYSAAQVGLPIFEYTPIQIKVAVTGAGGADKQQVMRMTEKLAILDKKVHSDDEMDAIAIAITSLAIDRI